MAAGSRALRNLAAANGGGSKSPNMGCISTIHIQPPAKGEDPFSTPRRRRRSLPRGDTMTPSGNHSTGLGLIQRLAAVLHCILCVTIHGHIASTPQFNAVAFSRSHPHGAILVYPCAFPDPTISCGRSSVANFLPGRDSFPLLCLVSHSFFGPPGHSKASASASLVNTQHSGRSLCRTS